MWQLQNLRYFQPTFQILELHLSHQQKFYFLKFTFLHFSNPWNSNLNYHIKYLLWSHFITQINFLESQKKEKINFEAEEIIKKGRSRMHRGTLLHSSMSVIPWNKLATRTKKLRVKLGRPYWNLFLWLQMTLIN